MSHGKLLEDKKHIFSLKNNKKKIFTFLCAVI